MEQLDAIAAAALIAAEHGALPVAWPVGPNAVIEYGDGHNPFEDMTVTHWSVD